MVGGGGPDSIAERAGKERAGQTYIGNLSIAGATQPITRRRSSAVRQALDGWGVTTVVVPDPSHLPIYERLHEVRIAGRADDRRHRTSSRSARPDAWVWTGVDRAGPPVLVPAAARPPVAPVRPTARWPPSTRSTACVLAAPSATGDRLARDRRGA